MKYAITTIGGKQYHLQEGESVLIERSDTAKGQEIVFSDILLIRDEDELLIGTPTIQNASVVGVVDDEVKGKKLYVSKFKAKVRYRRTIGFRPKFTKVTIKTIQKQSVEKKSAATKKKSS